MKNVFIPDIYNYFCCQAFEEAKKRLQQETEDRKVVVPELRKQSRYDYLKKRQSDKMEDLALEIEEENYFFGDQKYVHFC